MVTSQLTVEFTAKCWLYSGKGTWHFVTLPTDCAAQISYFSKALNGGKRTGWGSVKVTAQIGNTFWQTSLFPDSKSKSYVLPIKAAVRSAKASHQGNPSKCEFQYQCPKSSNSLLW
ncbi:MAG: DUF1905 domain-containing protein [Polaromonas sp.]|nr:DUF1905 domain-containing protein [Polaromonas sp.]